MSECPCEKMQPPFTHHSSKSLQTYNIILWVLGVLSSGVKRPGYEADYSLLSDAKIKNN
jgi:hypothetical protein